MFLSLKLCWIYFAAFLLGDNVVVSENVNNLSVSSTFPSNPLLISWNNPNITNGEIFQYVIIILLNNQCVYTLSLNCTTCINNTNPKNPNNSSQNCNISESQFYNNQTFISTIINNTIIKPYTNYIISVIPINAYGWGNMSNYAITTGQYTSSAVTNVTINSAFPNDNLQILWQTPNNTNGIIMQYLIFVETNTCILYSYLNCSNCSSQTIGHIGEKNFTCPNSESNTSFLSTDKSVSLNITNYSIQPVTNYNISIIPVNGYGWGKSFITPYQTIYYSPGNALNVTLSSKESNITLSWLKPQDTMPNNYSYNILFSNNYTYNVDQHSINYSFPPQEYCSNYSACINTITPYGNSNQTCISILTGPSYVSIDYLNGSVIQRNNIVLNWIYSGVSHCMIMFNISYNGSTKMVNNNTNIATLSNLSYVTTYFIVVVPITYNIKNISRSGSNKSISVTTGEGIPSVLQNFTCVNASYHSILMLWGSPVTPNGIIANYCLIYQNNSTIIPATNVINYSYLLSDNVYPDILYTIQMAGQTSAGCGIYTMCSITIESSMSAYIINNSTIYDVMKTTAFTGTDPNTQICINLPYSLFNNKNGKIKQFTLVVAQKLEDIYQSSSLSRSSSNYPFYNPSYSKCGLVNSCVYEIIVDYPSNISRNKRSLNDNEPIFINQIFVIGSSCSQPNSYTCNGPLQRGTTYYIGFRVYTSTGFSTYSITANTRVWIQLIIGLFFLFVILIIAAIIVSFFYIRWRRNKQSQPEVEISNPVPSNPDELSSINHQSPLVRQFHSNFEFMQRDSNGRMIDDFQEIRNFAKQLETRKKLVFIEGNDMKNRYNNIKPYKHNRVRLNGQDDYINASRICTKHWHMDPDKQCECTDIYIATQGPLGETKESKLPTLGDFWRMVFENNVCVIINLTRCDESGREKCAQYWPDSINDKITFRSNGESIEVVLQQYINNDIFQERIMLISMNGIEKRITQLHMTAWVDHGCPKISEFLTFYKSYQKIRVRNQTVVVHCSAGVGRTGSFILIDEELSRISKETDKVEIFKNLQNLRKCRCLMVQTESQYCFVYSIIHEYLVKKGLARTRKNEAADHNTLSKQSYENPIFNETD